MLGELSAANTCIHPGDDTFRRPEFSVADQCINSNRANGTVVVHRGDRHRAEAIRCHERACNSSGIIIGYLAAWSAGQPEGCLLLDEDLVAFDSA
jgi:hypothetical protein